MAQRMLMVFLLVPFLCFLSVAHCQEDPRLKIHAKCIAETGSAETHVENAHNGIFAEDRNFKCYLKCFSVAVGGMAPDGTMALTEQVLQNFPLEQRAAMKKMAAVCLPLLGALKTDDHCERAFVLHKCAYSVDPSQYKLY